MFTMPKRLRGFSHPIQTDDPAAGGALTMNGDEGLVHDVATSVLNMRGILRLEPRLNDVIGRIDPARLFASSQPKAPEGLSVQTFGSITDVTVDVAISSARQALAAAEQIQDVLRSVIIEHGREPGRIVVNVLAIEHH